MRFKNGKRKAGLIALFSCILTATVAFAAYTGYNYINGQTEVMANPFKMVFFDKDGDEVTGSTELMAADYAEVTGDAEVSPITVSPDSITNFKVKLYKEGDSATYTLTLKNTGGSYAYLSAVDIAKTTLPTDDEGNPTSGLAYAISLAGTGLSGDPSTFTLTSADGAAVNNSPVGTDSLGYLTVSPAATVEVKLTVTATNNSLFSGGENATLDMGRVTISWSSVDPSGSST